GGNELSAEDNEQGEDVCDPAAGESVDEARAGGQREGCRKDNERRRIGEEHLARDGFVGVGVDLDAGHDDAAGDGRHPAVLYGGQVSDAGEDDFASEPGGERGIFVEVGNRDLRDVAHGGRHVTDADHALIGKGAGGALMLFVANCGGDEDRADSEVVGGFDDIRIGGGAVGGEGKGP